MIPKRYVLITMICAMAVICVCASLYGHDPESECPYYMTPEGFYIPVGISAVKSIREAEDPEYQLYYKHGETCSDGPAEVLTGDEYFIEYDEGETGFVIAYWDEDMCEGLVTQPVDMVAVYGDGETDVTIEDICEEGDYTTWTFNSTYGFLIEFDNEVFRIDGSGVSPQFWTGEGGDGGFTITLANTDCETLKAAENSTITVTMERHIRSGLDSGSSEGSGEYCSCYHGNCWVEKHRYTLEDSHTINVELDMDIDAYCEYIANGGCSGGSCSLFGPGTSVNPSSNPGDSGSSGGSGQDGPDYSGGGVIGR